MANLPESATYDAGVYQIETTDPVQGGPSGIVNTPLKNLVNRTAWLKQQVDALNSNQFPTGTAMLFQQTAAPTGWTKQTTHNDKALRVVSGTAGSGGSLAFSSAFASRGLSGTVQGTTLTAAQMPVHSHSNSPSGGNIAYANSATLFLYPATVGGGNYIGFGGINATANAGSGNSHDHGLVMNNLDMAVSYVDLIIATKN